MARIIEMSSKKGIELKTQNTYCEENIQVIPTFEIPIKAEVQYGTNNEYTKVLQGTYIGKPESIEVGVLENADENFVKTNNLNFGTTYIDNQKLPLNLEIKTAINLQHKQVTPSISQQTIRPDTIYDGLGQVTVSAVPLQKKRITTNGTIRPDFGYLGLSEIEVAVESSKVILQELTVTPTKQHQTFSPSSGYSGFSKVSIHPIPEEYIQPVGSFTITQNGDYNIAKYAFVDVNVKQPEGNYEINSLIGTTRQFDVQWYQTVTITIPDYLGAYEDL